MMDQARDGVGSDRLVLLLVVVPEMIFVKNDKIIRR